MAKTKTSSKVKDRYNAKAYDGIMVRVSKGRKDEIKAHCEARGESVNGFIGRAISETMERDNAAPGATERPTETVNDLPIQEEKPAPGSAEKAT